MKVLHDRNARWLPSRHRTALAKLIAFAKLRTAHTPQPTTALYVIDRDQSATEQFAMSVWLALTLTADLAALLPLRPWLAAVVAVVMSPWLLQIPTYVFGTSIRLPLAGNQSMNSGVTILLLAILSAAVAARPGPERFLAWPFFGVIALNATAWVLLRLFEGAIRRLEARCGV